MIQINKNSIIEELPSSNHNPYRKRDYEEPQSSALEEPSYSSVTKSSRVVEGSVQPSYIHVSKLVNSKDNTTNFFISGKSQRDFLNLIDPEITKKIIYLTLQTQKIYAGLAKKTLRIQAIQFERQIDKLVQGGIIKPLSMKNPYSDPFVRWAKTMNPNLAVKSLKLYKLTDEYARLFLNLESDLESYLDNVIVDEIKHYRFAIKRTHQDIIKEKKHVKLKQKKLILDASKNFHKYKIIGKCECGSDLIEERSTTENPDGQAKYRYIKSKPYCMECYRRLTGDIIGRC